MRSGSHTTSLAGLTLLLAGCGVVTTQSGRLVYGTPQTVVQYVVGVFDSYRIPVAGTVGESAVQSATFDPESVWNQAEVSARVSCTTPAEPKPVQGVPTVLLSLRARVVTVRTSAAPIIAPNSPSRRAMPTMSVSITSHGKRSDGASCTITEEFAQTLLTAISTIGGPSERAASN